MSVLPKVLNSRAFGALAPQQQEDIIKWLSIECHVVEQPDVWHEVVLFPGVVVVHSWNRSSGTGPTTVETDEWDRPLSTSAAYPATTPPPEALASLPDTWRWQATILYAPGFKQTPKEVVFMFSDVTRTVGDESFVASLTCSPMNIPSWVSSDETVAKVSSTTVDGLQAMIAVGRPGAAEIVAVAELADGSRVVCRGTVTVMDLSEHGAHEYSPITFSEPAA